MYIILIDIEVYDYVIQTNMHQAPYTWIQS